MSYDLIKEGDYVHVVPLQGESFSGNVRHIPQASGECWVIENEWDGVFYVQTFAHIRKSK